jgi:hypothetical protein
MKHIWSVICKKSIIDSETNNITLNEVLEEITFSFSNKDLIDKSVNFPFDFEIISYFTAARKNEKADMEIELLNPGKKMIGKFIQKIEFPENKLRLRVRIKTSGISVDKDGEYLFRIKIKTQGNEKFKTVSEIPIFIKKKFILNLK